MVPSNQQQNTRRGLRPWLNYVLLTCLGFVLSGCYMYSYFKRKTPPNTAASTFNSTVVGGSLGTEAGAINEAALAQVYQVQTTHAPAAIRPDPDLFVRRLLRQYRPESSTVARQIGKVEKFRLLLGGAPQNFATNPATTYDATSLLAVSKVADEVCRALVAPNSSEHPGWSSILPFPADQEQNNIAWLAQRLLGKPTAKIDPAIYPQLQAIMVAEEPAVAKNWWATNNSYAKYIVVCAALTLTADSLYN